MWAGLLEVDCGVVVSVSTELTAPPLGVKEAGLARQFVPFGKGDWVVLRQLIITAWVKLLTGETVTV